MWLLNANTLKLEYHPDITKRPGYAILSYTWGSTESEVSYDDIRNLNEDVTVKEGFRKIKNTCCQALEDGHESTWIDTCESQSMLIRSNRSLGKH